jgi:2-dehydropantoate 2-reductase
MSSPNTSARVIPYKQIAVMGTGAVGGYFGGMLARAGIGVTFIARPAVVEAIERQGLFIDSINFQESVRAAASSDPSAVRGADLVLFCVKTLDTASVAKGLAPYLTAGSVVLSLQNGVENIETIRAASGIEALASVVFVAASMPEPGRIKHVGRGELLIGDAASPSQRQNDLDRIVATFVPAGVPCRISPNIHADLWSKLVMNCAYNALSAIAQTNYGAASHNPACREVIAATAREAIAVAGAAGVTGLPPDLLERCLKLGDTMPQAVSSTAQDVARRKHTEIDALNGVIIRRGREFGVPTPVNHTLTAILKLIEEKF